MDISKTAVWEVAGVVFFGDPEGDHDRLTPDEAAAKAPALIVQGNQAGVDLSQRMNDLRGQMETLEIQYRQAQHTANLGNSLIIASAQARAKLAHAGQT